MYKSKATLRSTAANEFRIVSSPHGIRSPPLCCLLNGFRKLNVKSEKCVPPQRDLRAGWIPTVIHVIFRSRSSVRAHSPTPTPIVPSVKRLLTIMHLCQHPKYIRSHQWKCDATRWSGRKPWAGGWRANALALRPVDNWWSCEHTACSTDDEWSTTWLPHCHDSAG